MVMAVIGINFATLFFYLQINCLKNGKTITGTVQDGNNYYILQIKGDKQLTSKKDEIVSMIYVDAKQLKKTC